ncbi:MAG TPA: hypothetical protein VL401_03070 [Alphaproteobacteria bacterium]|jgi:hypothetical protein|nr:hypothetical protein [Alphaproteobacteria bacterium]
MKSKSKFLIYLLLATLSLAVFIGVYYYFRNLKNKPSIVSESPAPIPVIDTSNWKTYTNTKYGFSFKYPPTTTMTLYTPNDAITLHDSAYQLNTTVSWGKPLETINECPSPPATGVKPGPIPNSYRCDFTQSHFKSIVFWVVGDDNKTFSTNTYNFDPMEPISQEGINHLSQILSTFKFTNNHPDWSQFKTSGYSIMLPPYWTTYNPDKDNSTLFGDGDRPWLGSGFEITYFSDAKDYYKPEANLLDYLNKNAENKAVNKIKIANLDGYSACLPSSVENLCATRYVLLIDNHIFVFSSPSLEFPFYKSKVDMEVLSTFKPIK